ncbi:hypothetical protein QJS66_21155 [Kocuria rhizophila]|nr:hypothetical protein QJS66_21155 [Kocuria rhizophila]
MTPRRAGRGRTSPGRASPSAWPSKTAPLEQWERGPVTRVRIKKMLDRTGLAYPRPTRSRCALAPSRRPARTCPPRPSPAPACPPLARCAPPRCTPTARPRTATHRTAAPPAGRDRRGHHILGTPRHG